jgi:hypothetical protein
LSRIALSDDSLALNQKSSQAARDSPQRTLGCDLFIREARNVCTLTGVLDGDAKDIAALIEIQDCVLIQILRFGYFGWLELDMECVSVLKIFDVHGVTNTRCPVSWLAPILFTLPFFDIFRLLRVGNVALGLLSFLSDHLALLQSPLQSNLYEI